MSKYNLEARFPFKTESSILDEATISEMWKLFEEICKHWKNVEDPSQMKSNLLVFMNNRIQINPNYVNDYRNAAEVIRELINEMGEEQAYNKLLTDAAANIAPPATRLARARQLVSNEFVALQLALGGFRGFSNATNYVGYFGGANVEGYIPYRTYEENQQ